MLKTLWSRYANWQVRRWRRWADATLQNQLAHLEHEIDLKTRLLEIREVELEQAKEIIARDRARVQAETAQSAREIAG